MKKNEERIPSCGGIEVPNRDTELVFILDRSGSMAGFEEDTVGGFNAMLEKQKNGEGQVYVSTVLFANRDYENENEFSFRAEGTVAIFDSEDGEFIALESEDGIYRMTLGEGDAVLVKIEK